jgi:hypothetical protein
MRTRQMQRSIVEGHPSAWSEPIADRHPSGFEPRGRRVRRGVLITVVGGLAVALLAAGAVSRSTASGSTASGRAPTSSVPYGWSCYLPKPSDASARANLMVGAPGASTTTSAGVAPRIPGLYGIEQIGSHLLCR